MAVIRTGTGISPKILVVPNWKRIGLFTGTVTPSATINPSPRATPYIPRVPMNGGICRPAISQPLIIPGTITINIVAITPIERAKSGSCPPRLEVIVANTTAANPIANPMDRSIPPAMITNVTPIPSSRGAAAKVRML